MATGHRAAAGRACGAPHEDPGRHGLRLIVANFVVVGVLARDGGRMLRRPPWAGAAVRLGSPSSRFGWASRIPPRRVLCHEAGGSAGMKPVPAIGHPLAGWTACLACHTNEDLGRGAPGHEGIDQAECLNCHREAQEGPPITQAHADLNEACLDCHGDFAHLPTSMVGRNQDECWLCHKPNPERPPQKPHPDRPELTCRTCHQASDVGALPIDRAAVDSSCVPATDGPAQLAPRRRVPGRAGQHLGTCQTPRPIPDRRRIGMGRDDSSMLRGPGSRDAGRDHRDAPPLEAEGRLRIGPRGQRLVPIAEVTRLLAERRRAGTDRPIVAQSARNRFPGIVTRIEKDRVAAVVEVLAGPHRVVSLMTAEAVDDMWLRVGDEAVCVVKATNVIVEVPSPRESRA
jgi:molybdopterin-binding protein